MRSAKTPLGVVALVVAQVAAADIALADSILSGSFSGMNGAVAVNLGAGSVIDQVNVRSLAVGESAAAIASASVTQEAGPNTGVAEAGGAAVISGSFSGASGMFGVNQAVGYGILQANVVAIAVGINGLAIADVDLAQVNANAPIDGEDGAGGAYAGVTSISADSFAGASGIVQVSQAVGAYHTTANRFAMIISDGVVP